MADTEMDNNNDAHRQLLAAACELTQEANSLCEQLRATALKKMKILDTPSEEVFDDILALAAKMTDCPGAVLTFIDTDRAYVKGSINGPPVGSEPRDHSLCNTTIQTPEELLIVKDARVDPRFAENPKVKSGMCTFYAGKAVLAPDGTPIGAVCVGDSVPRELDEDEKAGLETLARIVTHILAGRTDEAKS